MFPAHVDDEMIMDIRLVVNKGLAQGVYRVPVLERPQGLIITLIQARYIQII
jgi:hypothetical protein